MALNTAMVVDDDSATRMLLRTILEAEGFAVLEAAHGEEALAIIWPNSIPDVVLTDLTMPVLDGIKLIEKLRSEPATAGIPIMVVSSADATRNVQTFARVDSVVKKPFDAADIARRIRALAGNSGRSAPAA